MTDPDVAGGWLPTVTWVVVVLLYAALAGTWTAHEPGWYAQLAKPSFQPPDVVFGIMWPLNFLALLVVGVWFTRSSEATGVWPGPVVGEVEFDLPGWAYPTDEEPQFDCDEEGEA